MEKKTLILEPAPAESNSIGPRLNEVIKSRRQQEPEVTLLDTDSCEGVWLCRILRFCEGVPELEIPGRISPVTAYAVSCSLSSADIGTVVAVSFDRGSVKRPIIIGKVLGSADILATSEKQVAVTADDEISLRCGKASITMKADGTVAIRGSNVISRASHTNRIRGGNVQIN